MTEIRPMHVVDAYAPDRSGEVTALREALSHAEQLAGRVVDAEAEAERCKKAFGALLQDWARVVAERDNARDALERARRFTIAVAEQRPAWHEPA